MAIAACSSKAIKQLAALGVIPKECRRFSLTAEAGGTVRVQYEAFASEEDVQNHLRGKS